MLQLADPQTVYERPANMFVAGFIGSPSRKFTRAEIVANEGGLLARIDGVANEAGRIALPLADGPAIRAYPAGPSSSASARRR